MPTYDYQCDACGHSFEAFQSMRDDALTVCPQCEKPALRRLITGGAGVIFKGSGFYVNDSKGTKTAAKTAAKSGDSSGSESTKPAPNTDSTATTESTAKSEKGSTQESKSGEKKTA